MSSSSSSGNPAATGSSGNASVASSRALLKSASFNPSQFIGQQLSTVPLEGVDSEEKIFRLFDELSAHLLLLSEEIEEEVGDLQSNAMNMEAELLEEIDHQLEKLKEVDVAVDTVKFSFQHASEGAIRIGSKLASTEKERLQIQHSIELLQYIQEFQSMSIEDIERIPSMDILRLQELLPMQLGKKTWPELAQLLHDLHKITLDLNKDDVSQAQLAIIHTIQVVETELLGQFDNAIEALMKQPQNMEALNKAKYLATILQLFSNGQTVQKRYIFTVIQKRIPNDVFFTKESQNTHLLQQMQQAIQSIQKTGFHDQDRDSEEDSSVGASDDASDDEDGNEAANPYLQSLQQAKQIRQKEGGGKMAPNLMANLKSLAIDGSINNNVNKSFQLLDHLSGLFSMINSVCLEQFALIRTIFPTHCIARVTRLLVQRIFNDPAFGIQAKIDEILCPPAPAPPLALAEYLDALLTVREKLSALNVLLLECCNDPVMMGMGSDSASLRKAKQEVTYFTSSAKGNNIKSSQKNDPGDGEQEDGEEGVEESKGPAFTTLDHSEEEALIEERLRSDAEIKEFFDEQIAQVLVTYLMDYFDKEMAHLRAQYVSYLRKYVDDGHNVVFAGSVLVPPHIKAEKCKSLNAVRKCFAFASFMKSFLAMTTDSVVRMESIGRDDERRLANYLKDAYFLQSNVLFDGVYGPLLKQATTLLLRTASLIYKQYSAGVNNVGTSNTQSNSMIGYDILDILVSVSRHRDEEAAHFTSLFVKPLSQQPNLLAIVKEHRKKNSNQLLKACKEALYAWEVGIVLYLEKTLSVMQAKSDYAPKGDPIATLLQANATMANNTGIGVRSSAALVDLYNTTISGITGGGNTNQRLYPTSTCDIVCRTIIQITQQLRQHEAALQHLDLNSLFWRPLGQQFIAALISHIRKYKIPHSGARQLLRDLQEYRNIVQLMNSPETLDMMICLEEICILFIAPADDLVRIIAEDMRHLDTSIVLAIVKCRADFHAKSTPDYYSRILVSTYSDYKWEAPLPWEGKKPLTVVAFNEAFQLILADQHNPNPTSNPKNNNSYVRMLGPKTLRKASSMLPLSSLYMQEIMQQQAATNERLKSGLGNAIRMSTTGAISIDLAALEQNKHYNPYDLDRHQSRLMNQIGNSQDDGDGNGGAGLLFSPGPRPVSKYLSRRPDDPIGTNNNNGNNNNQANGNRSKSTDLNNPSSIQISRPDLIGVNDPMQTPKSNVKKRPSTISTKPVNGVNATNGKDANKGNNASDGNKSSNSSVQQQANNQGAASQSTANTASSASFGSAFNSAVSFLPTSFMSPPPVNKANNTGASINNNNNNNKAGSNSMLKSMSSFFSKG